MRIFLLSKIGIRRDGVFHFAPGGQGRAGIAGNRCFGLGHSRIALGIKASAREQGLDETGHEAGGDALRVDHVGKFGLAGRD